MKIEINVLEHPLTLATFASMFWMLNSKIKKFLLVLLDNIFAQDAAIWQKAITQF
jgi:hypothetical protein